MAKLARRGFLKWTSVSAASIGLVAGIAAGGPRLAAMAAPAETNAAMDPSLAAIPEPVMAYVRNIATSEVSLMVGTKEIIYRDPELVMRLLKAAK